MKNLRKFLIINIVITILGLIYFVLWVPSTMIEPGSIEGSIKNIEETFLNKTLTKNGLQSFHANKSIILHEAKIKEKALSLYEIGGLLICLTLLLNSIIIIKLEKNLTTRST